MSIAVFENLNPHTFWYISRGAGIVAWSMSTLAVVFGLSFSARTRYPKPNWALAVHRHTAALTLYALATHIIVLFWDGWLKPSYTDILIPFHMQWQAFAVGLGQLAAILLILVQISGFVQKRIPKKLWHLWHLLAFPAWIMSTWHYLQAGSDVSGLAALPALIGVVAVLVAMAWRFGASAGRAGRGSKRPAQKLEPVSQETIQVVAAPTPQAWTSATETANNSTSSPSVPTPPPTPVSAPDSEALARIEALRARRSQK